ncbi:MAG: hypothetical protein EBR82_54960 [Caulobacteraceae bacterium]|nr:hypothetical protein [Caulobacteraceae bacterium]
MADKKISALTAATTPLAGTEILPIVQLGTTVKVANNDLRPKQIQSNATSGVLQVSGPAAAATRVMTVPDADFTAARTDAGQTFTGTQVMTSPKIVTSINDINGNESLLLTATANAVNELTVANAATGNRPSISASGSDTNIGISITPKGSGNTYVTANNLLITGAANKVTNKTGVTATLAQNASENIFDTGGNAGLWQVSAIQSDGGTVWRASAEVFFNGASATVYSKVGNNITVSMSGNNIRLTNTNVSDQAFFYSVLCLL